MRTFTVLILAFLLLTSFGGSKDNVAVYPLPADLPLPPGTVELCFNVYMDKSEITNIEWEEFSWWMKEAYGVNSHEYKSTLRDTLVWRDSIPMSYCEPYVEYYHSHPAYASYPAVGVSYEQAIAYCQWRSDRVYEILLQKKGIILLDDSNRYLFTIDKFLAGDFPTLNDERPPFPVYELPGKVLWESAASGGNNVAFFPYGINTDIKPFKKALKKKMSLFNLVNRQGFLSGKYDPSIFVSYTAPAISYFPNDYGLYNMIGNVAEMIDEKGIAKGGGFKHTASESQILKNQQYSVPNYWLGFRCSAHWENPKTDQ